MLCYLNNGHVIYSGGQQAVLRKTTEGFRERTQEFRDSGKAFSNSAQYPQETEID